MFIAKLPDENLVLVIAFLFLNLFKFRYFSFLKDFVKKKVILSIFINVQEGSDTAVLRSFWENLGLFLFSFLSISSVVIFFFIYLFFLSHNTSFKI